MTHGVSFSSNQNQIIIYSKNKQSHVVNMVHSTFFFIGTLAALSGMAATADCVEGYAYCG